MQAFKVISPSEAAIVKLGLCVPWQNTLNLVEHELTVLLQEFCLHCLQRY